MVRLSAAIPTRRDRNDLRHRLWQVHRDVRREQAQALTRELSRLARGHETVVRISHGRARGFTALEFRDGTHLALRIRDSTFDLERLPSSAPRPIARLDGFERCFGHSWYWLHFLSTSYGELDVLARVVWPGTLPGADVDPPH